MSYDPNMLSLVRGSGERYGRGARYGDSPPMVWRRGEAVVPETSGLFQHLYWRVSDDSVGDEEDEDLLTGKAKVNGGVIFIPELAYPDHYGKNPALKPHVALEIPDAFFPDAAPAPPEVGPAHPGIHNGDTLYLRINWTVDPVVDEGEDPPAREAEYRLDFIAESGDILDTIPVDGEEYETSETTTSPVHFHTVLVDSQAIIVKSSGSSKVAAHLLVQPVKFLNYSWGIVNGPAPDDTRTQTYIPIADFEVDIDTGAMTIKQRAMGFPLFVHPYLFYYGAGKVVVPP